MFLNEQSAAFTNDSQEVVGVDSGRIMCIICSDSMSGGAGDPLMVRNMSIARY